MSATVAVGLVVFLLVSSVNANSITIQERDEYDPVIPDQDWGYVDVRPSAHMFWWLYGCTDNTKSREQVPLVMWLQGGPGGSGTGFGNFGEIGPLDVDLKPRNTSWTQAANILFVDNPVGSGYSYTDNDSAFTTDVNQIAKDLLTLFKAFLKTHEVFQKMHFYIFCESYGGTMTAVFAEALQEAVHSGEVVVRLSGVALGDSWISPIDYVKAWGPFLYATSLVNEDQLSSIQQLASKAELAINDGQYAKATDLWAQTSKLIENVTDSVDFYNILRHHSPDGQSLKGMWEKKQLPHLLARYHGDPLSALMNGPIKQQLKIPEKVVWGAQADEVFDKLKTDFMKDVIGSVDRLLAMGVNVTVYNGQLDIICCIQGTIAWIDKLTWPSLPKFKAAKRTPVYPLTDSSKINTGGFYQAYQNLALYWILKAGHLVPVDAGDMSLTMLKRIINV